MYFIVENERDLSKLEQLGVKGCFLDIITTNDLFHPKLTELVAVYVRPLIEKVGYIIPISHEEGLNVSVDRVIKVLKKYSKIYVLDKKKALYFFNFGKETIGLNLKYAMLHYDKLDLGLGNKTVNWFYNRYGGKPNINQIVPLVKLYERSENFFSKVESLIEEEEPAGFQYYNEFATKAYFMVEQAGLRVDVHNFEKYYKPTNLDFSVNGEMVYTSYNLCNSTSRPTNAFNAVNFLALPKGKEFRQCFKVDSGHSYVEFDYDGYHIRLVAKQIGYKLKRSIKAHKQLGKLWTGKDEFDDTEYEKLKGLNFQIIYGAIPEEYKHFDFAQKIQNYIDSLWKDFKGQGFAENVESHKQFTTELKDMKPNKLMNYMVQSLETSRNIRVLCKLLKVLKGYKTSIVLITYDAFTVDWCEEDGVEVLMKVKEVMEEGGFPVKVRRSKDLRFE